MGEWLARQIKSRQKKNLIRLPGPFGDFNRDGGNELLYDLPVSTNDLVVDAGGFEGEWTSGMIARYGCRSEIFEPIPSHVECLNRMFAKNDMVNVHRAALGGSTRTTEFSLLSNSSSEFIQSERVNAIEVSVVDVHEYLGSLNEQSIACLKLNIEGGEYEVLERLCEQGGLDRIKSLLIQFHRQPEGWDERRSRITTTLQSTHDCEWSYSMVWEKWVRR
ncbi:FkbM family methyltransferase [Novipirellula sp. SH528]|uniref:FkbM family methyltransferase n=1 Tax=Novipirellula sp. SH528 TaxID=3454466 RepID=UPI003FA13346